MSVPQLQNAFVTKTFPNHWTLVTGVYEETHGIVANHMFDPVLNESFGMSTCGTWWDRVGRFPCRRAHVLVCLCARAVRLQNFLYEPRVVPWPHAASGGWRVIDCGNGGTRPLLEGFRRRL